MTNSVFLDKIPCSLVEVYQLHCLRNFYQILRRHIQHDSALNMLTDYVLTCEQHTV